MVKTYKIATMFNKNEIKKILIMRSDGIGDFILSLPAMDTLRRSFPGAYIVLFTSNWQEALAKKIRIFNEIIIWDNSKNYYLTCPTKFKYLSYRMLRYIPRINSLKFDLAIDYKGDLRNQIIMWLCSIRFRFGFTQRLGRFLLTHPTDYKKGIHKSTLYWQLISPLIDSVSMVPYNFVISKEDRQKAENFLLEEGVSEKDRIIVIHPVARWQAKTWPKEKFAKLSNLLLSLPLIKVIFIGAKEDLPAIIKIKNIMHGKPIISAERLDFLETAAIIQRAQLFVGNDAAPMHMANILNIQSIGLFGPTDPKTSGPQGEKSIVIRKIAGRCPGCFKNKPGKCLYPQDFCMDKISVEEVFDICMNYLKN